MKSFLTAAIATAVWLLGAWPTTAAAQDKPQAYVNAHLIPIAGPEIDNGVLVVKGGKIVAVGKSGEVKPPDGAEVHDEQGRTIMPGLVDTHSHIGCGAAGGDGSAPIQPDVRIIDAINVRDPGLQK